VCPNQLDNLFSVTVPDLLATAVEPRRPANNTGEKSPKGKERQDFKLSKCNSELGIAFACYCYDVPTLVL